MERALHTFRAERANRPTAIAGPTRRAMLERMGAGLGALALEAMTRQVARAQTPALDPLRPYAPRPPRLAPQATSVIFLFMVGGPSQIDTFDHKPELQKLHGKPLPESFRASIKGTKLANVLHDTKSEVMGSPYAWSQHGRCGMDLRFAPLSKTIARAFALVLQRPPTERELAATRELLARSSLAEVCRVLLNVNEAIYVD